MYLWRLQRKTRKVWEDCNSRQEYSFHFLFWDIKCTRFLLIWKILSVRWVSTCIRDAPKKYIYGRRGYYWIQLFLLALQSKIHSFAQKYNIFWGRRQDFLDAITCQPTNKKWDNLMFKMLLYSKFDVFKIGFKTDFDIIGLNMFYHVC